MIVTFRSRATADVIMFGAVAHQLMAIIGKEAGAQGIVTVEQLPEAIARLRAAIAQDKARHADIVAEGLDGLNGLDDARSTETDVLRPAAIDQPVSLTQRAVPLLEMLERSLRHQKPVVWGV
ncbi:MAG: DUF1840 domain-containing protein [Sterolibacterium sp.]|nr:DUF1840 domain-containing protein [Sterolibacterium sp.]